MNRTLEAAGWRVNPDLQYIFTVLEGKHQRTRAVGGIVRDTLMKRARTSADIDLATEFLPDEVVRRSKAAGIATYPTGIAHGTITLKAGETIVEVTTLRQDVKTDGRHAIVIFGHDWLEDARRRDFTLNALYCTADGMLYDPLGSAEDVYNHRVRFIGDPSQRIAEDGLRVYRFFRFSASHGEGSFDPDGLAACADAAGKLDHLSRERIGMEMLRMLGLPRIAGTIAEMVRIGLLKTRATMLAELAFYENIGGRAASARLVLFAADDLATMQRRWRLSNTVMKQATDIDKAARLIAGNKIHEAAYRYGKYAVEGLAVAASRAQWSQSRMAEAAGTLKTLMVPPFPVSGKDLIGLGMEPDRSLGQELVRLEHVWIDSGFVLGKTALLKMVRLNR